MLKLHQSLGRRQGGRKLSFLITYCVTVRYWALQTLPALRLPSSPHEVVHSIIILILWGPEMLSDLHKVRQSVRQSFNPDLFDSKGQGKL